MSYLSKRVLLFALMVCVGFFYCTRYIKSPVSNIDEINVPPTPQRVVLSFGDGRIDLSWETSDSTKIKGFKVYRSDTSSAAPSLFDSCPGFRYSDLGLKNGREYFYQISSVDSNNFEGYKSEIVSARPNLFTVVINNGQKLTNSRDVTLSLLAPSGTSYMMIDNDSSFSAFFWERYSSSKSWRLDAGDGEKWVYVQFKDSDGNVSVDFCRDQIILDTQAYIKNLSENTGGHVKTTGDTIHFTLNSGETNGQARVDLGNITNIALYDNGEFGDTTADDGIYQLDYVIPPGVEMEEATLKGHFADEAGNVAQTVTAPGTITVRVRPDAVTLFEPSDQTQSSLTLHWSQSAASDFHSYRLYRAKLSSVDSSSTLVTVITSKLTASYTDSNLEDSTAYFYRVYVYDNTGLSAGSNVKRGVTLKNQAPKAVSLSATSAHHDSTVILSWTQNEDSDFESYRIRKSKAPVHVTESSDVVNIITQQSTTSFTDGDVKPDSLYYYKVFVYDRGGLSSPSNEVSGP